MAPFGSLLAGFMASRIGAPRTVMLCGVICVAGAAWFMSQLKELRRMIRPIYVQLGILPQMAAGVQQATNLHSTMER